jgi:hypothetical protein
MKDEKLKSMLNKVVEYNDPKAYNGKGCNFKAFLYKNNIRGYYFKVVEVLSGTDLAFNDIIYLNEGDEKHLVVADKPKLMRVSLKSWHYRLIKYVLRDSAPTPKTMQNGCPYFWLLVFSMFSIPFILLFKALKWAVLLIPKMLFWVLEQMVENWIAGLDDEVAYDMHYNGVYGNKKMPKTAKIYFQNSGDNFFDFFLSKKYKDLNPDAPDYQEKKKEMRDKWNAWRDDLDNRRAEARKLKYQEEAKRAEIRYKREQKARERAKRWDDRMKPINDGFKEIGLWFKKTFTVERGRVNVIVKRTKQFVGLLVTLVVLAATFFAVNYIALALMVVIDLLIVGWVYVVLTIALLAVIGLLYLLYVLLSSWVQGILNRYERGKKVWYVQPFIYLIFYPLKYIFLALAWVVIKVLWEIVKFIFYTVLFKYFLKPIGLFIAKVFVGLWKGILGSTGVFGEYFGASYSDYCPGIEWCDIDED